MRFNSADNDIIVDNHYEYSNDAVDYGVHEYTPDDSIAQQIHQESVMHDQMSDVQYGDQAYSTQSQNWTDSQYTTTNHGSYSQDGYSQVQSYSMPDYSEGYETSLDFDLNNYHTAQVDNNMLHNDTIVMQPVWTQEVAQQSVPSASVSFVEPDKAITQIESGGRANSAVGMADKERSIIPHAYGATHSERAVATDSSNAVFSNTVSNAVSHKRGSDESRKRERTKLAWFISGIATLVTGLIVIASFI